MSFSSDIKQELTALSFGHGHCRLAEIAAILSGSGQILIDEDDEICVEIRTENRDLGKRYYSLVKKTLGITPVAMIHKNSKLDTGETYRLLVDEHEAALALLEMTEVLGPKGEIRENVEEHQQKLLKRECCRYAYLRGAFLATGSISDPNKSYHLEIVCMQPERAQTLKSILESVGLHGKIVQRKKSYVVYMKEGEQILQFLAGIGSRSQLFDLENIRILKEMRNNLNRQINCETANMGKTITAAVRQVEDIQYIERTKGFDILPPQLRQMAELRLEYPESPLKELGEMLNPPVGKSGVNHRLRKLGEIAEKLRESQRETLNQ